MTGDETGPGEDDVGEDPSHETGPGNDGVGRDRSEEAGSGDEDVDGGPGGGSGTRRESDTPGGEPDCSGAQPTAEGRGGDTPSNTATGVAGTVRWLLHTDDDPVAFVREFARSAGIVLLIGVLLFAVSGVWPPMVAVESPSMEPHMQPGDLVFLMDQNRFPPEAAQSDTGIVTRDGATAVDYRRFNGYGDVIVFATPARSSRGQPPIIHRAQFWVEEGENWYDRAEPEHVTGGNCSALRHCPAPHDGFITRGDANRYYDQVQGLSPPVRPEWVRGTAEVRAPLLGCVRLYFEGSVPRTCRL